MLEPAIRRMRVEAFIWDIHCERCATTVEQTLASTPGIDHVSIDATGAVDITFRPDEVALTDIVEAIGNSGFVVVINAVSAPRDAVVSVPG